MLKSMFVFVTLVFLSTNSFAAGETPTLQNQAMQFLPLVAVFLIFYFLMIRPQKKKFEEEQAFINKLAKGDEVYTKSGLIGTIFGLNDKIVDLEVSNGVKLKILKSQIAGLSETVLKNDKK